MLLHSGTKQHRQAQQRKRKQMEDAEMDLTRERHTYVMCASSIGVRLWRDQ